MTGIGARSITSVVLAVAAAFALWQGGLVRADYWAQLSPWVPFLVGCFAVLAGTLVFRFWRLGERSEYYFRIGERLPFGGETSLGGPLLVGHAPQVETIDFPPVVQRVLYIAIASCIALVTVTNRAVALLREVPASLDKPSREFCAPPKVAKPADTALAPGCKLVQRAYKLGYAKDLGSCAPRTERDEKPPDICTKRQPDEPYLHYAWRLLDTHTRDLFTAAGPEQDGFPEQLDYLGELVDATADAVAMRPRSSHHLFTNLPDPRAGFVARARAAIDDSPCGARLAHLPHFPRLDDPSALLEQVMAQLLFTPAYKPSVAQCREVVVHWGAPADACARLAENPTRFLDDQDALEPVTEVLRTRRTQAELERHRVRRRPGELAAPQRIVSFQCLIADDPKPTAAPVEREVTVDGEPFKVREVRLPPKADQIKLYKQLAELFAEGFGYGRLTSNQAVGALPERATLAAQFKEPALLLTKLDVLRDADLFLGNEWLGEQRGLLDVYPYHLHLQNFIEIFRRQYALHRGRL
jgi:hypothetical protein